jgi:DNA ligase (NAD+)
VRSEAAGTVEPMETTPFDTRTDLQEARSRAESAARSYYDSDSLEMDDATYDSLVWRIKATEDLHPDWAGGGVTTQVAAGVSAGGDVTHSAAMLSLDNVFDQGELEAWYARLCKAADVDGSLALLVEPKLDGLALAARYEAGDLVMVVTRGDGVTGEDVTSRVRHVVGLPATLPEPVDIEVRGECVMTHDQFEQACEARVKEGKAPFANPRNAVAGSVRALHTDNRAGMTFAAYGVVGNPLEDAAHSVAMAQLADWGVHTAAAVAGLDLPESGLGEVISAIEKLRAGRGDLDCDIDGAVVKADDPDVRARAGFTSRAPRWAIAYKYPADSRLTELLDIEVSVGRTGNLSFTAVLEPVAVGGVTVERATLHNPGEIARKDVRLGDDVWVRRAGEVIPEVVGPHIDTRPDDRAAWTPPVVCPRCESTIDKGGAIWRCSRGRACGLAEQIVYAVSRSCLDIEGLGEVHVTALVDAGVVGDVADVYELTADKLAGLERLGETSAANIIDEIAKAKQLPLSKQLTALGLRMTGRRISRRLAQAFPTMTALRAATVEQLAEVDSMGPVRAESVVEELASLSDVVDRLEALGVNLTEPVADTSDKVWAGKKVCATGRIEGLSRDEVNAAVESLGATATSSVSKNTDLLVVGSGGGSKRAKAEKLGVPVMDGDEFLALLDGTQA